MSIAQSRITVQGQISVPAEVRRKLGLAPGSVLEWYEQGGEVFVRRAAKYTSQEVHDAIFTAPPEAKSPAEMDQGVRDRMRHKHERR